MGPQHAYFINDPEMIRDLFVVNAHKFHKGRALQRAKSLLGNGLLTAEGETHLRHRRMIQPEFHRQRIAEYSRWMVDYGELMSAKWRKGQVLDLDKEMMHLTLQIVGKTLFGAEVGGEADEVGRAMSTIVGMFNYLLLPFSEWLEKLPIPHSRRYHSARDTLNNVIYKIINERRRFAEDTGDLLSMLLLAQDETTGQGLTDEQVRDEALTLFLAGHETTANALTWTWYLLSQNPEAEAKLHDELHDVLGGRVPTFDDIPLLRYTEAVLAESMRLFPPAWTIGRLAIEPHEFGGYRIPQGSLILASQFVMHRDARFWPDAERFIPDRWLSQSVKEATQRFVYFPFGGGVRRCIGESFAWTEGVLLLAVFAASWKLRMVPDQRVGLQPMITLRPKYGMRMATSRH